MQKEELDISSTEYSNSEWKKNLAKSVLFVGIFVVLLTMLSYMIRATGDTKDRFEGFYAEPNNTIDMVIIGSSPAYSSIVPAKLYGDTGIRSYPLASNVQRPVAGLYLTKEALKTQSPKLFVYEMRMYVGLQVGLVSNMAYTRDVLDNMKYSFNRNTAINAMVDDPLERYTYYFDIFKYHSNWKTLIMPGQIASFRYERKNPTKGYTITDLVGPTKEPVNNIASDSIELDPFQKDALNDLLEFLTENNLSALFYVSPYDLADEDAGKYLTIKSMVEAAGFEFLDMNQNYDATGIDFESDFSDYGVHTNAVGAAKITDYFETYIAANYDLPDHRTDSDSKTNKSWEKAYEDWIVQYDESKRVIAERIENEDWTVEEDD